MAALADLLHLSRDMDSHRHDIYTGDPDLHPPPVPASNPPLLCLGHHALVLARVDVVERSLEMSFGIVQRRRLRTCLEIRMDQLDQAIEILGRDL